jgi:hypothetical protein
MNNRTQFARLALIVLALFVFAACGGVPGTAAATLADIPAYTGATELKPGESTIADTLVQNMQQTQAAGANIEQKGFNLPSDTQWAAVNSFYEEKLKAAGWGVNSTVNNIMAQANANNDMAQMANWQRGKQNLTIIMITDPTNTASKQLVMSLATNP